MALKDQLLGPRRIYCLTGRGDELMLDVEAMYGTEGAKAIEEAERILREAASQSCSFAVNLGDRKNTDLVPANRVDELLGREDVASVHVLRPMAGG